MLDLEFAPPSPRAGQHIRLLVCTTYEHAVEWLLACNLLRFRQRWGLARRFPWRYESWLCVPSCKLLLLQMVPTCRAAEATVQDNDTILVGTEDGWRPAKIVGTSPVNDTVDLAFSGEGRSQKGNAMVMMKMMMTDDDGCVTMTNRLDSRDLDALETLALVL